VSHTLPDGRVLAPLYRSIVAVVGGQRDQSFDMAAKAVCRADDLDNAKVDAQLQRPAPASTPGVEPGALDRALAVGTRASEMLGLVRSTLFPAYRRAIDALDPIDALELARQVVGAIQVAEEGKRDVVIATPDDDYHRFLVSTPGQAAQSEAAIASKFARLGLIKAELLSGLPVTVADLAMKIGPQMFRDQPVLGSYAMPVVGKDAWGYLAGEAGAAVELLAVVQRVRAVSGAAAGTCPMLTAGQAEEIVGLIEPWKSRPVNFAFLVRVLSEESIWQEVSTVRGKSGKTLEQTNASVLAQVQETGALADVGELDTDSLNALFGMDPTDPARMEHGAPVIDDETAMKVFDKLREAAPDARGPLVRQIDAMGELGELCSHLPWKYVEAVYDSVAPLDPEAAALIAPHYQDKGGGKSMHRIYMDEVDERLEDDQTIRAFGWFFADFLHNAFTAGFQHEYSDAYDSHEQGWTTDDQFGAQTTKALGKAALITAVSALTGGVAGEFAEGLAVGLGASKSAAQIIGGGVGGFAGGVSGHLTGDVFDQMLNGKEGFDSLGAYMQSGALGGGMGTVLAGISVGAGKYLGNGARPLDAYAARFPRMSRVLEDIRGAGFRSGSAVRMKVSELLDLMSSGFGGPGGPNAFAYAGAYGDVRALPPDTEISVRMRPLRPLTQPMQMSGVGNGNSNAPKETAVDADQPVVAIEKVEVVKPDPAEPPLVEEVVVDGMSMPSDQWVARLKATMTVEEVTQFDQMRSKFGTDEQIQNRFKGDFEAARQQTRGALAGKQGKLAAQETSRARAAQLRAAAEARGFLAEPEVVKIFDELGPNPSATEFAQAVEQIRSRIVGDTVAAETAANYPGKQVLRDVKIREETPATNIDDYMDNYARAEGKTSPSGLTVQDTPSGPRVFIERTDIDILVLERRPDGGKHRIVHREEVKSGKNDQATGKDGAQRQLEAGERLISNAAHGKTRIRIEANDVDITDQIDLGSVDSSTGVLRGPAGKTGFKESLGATAEDLRAMVDELVREQVATRARGVTDE
jgi:hypothetical protein